MLGVALGGTFERHTMYVSPGLAVDIRRNADATEDSNGDDFLCWPVLAEIDPEDSVADRDVVETVSTILNAFWMPAIERWPPATSKTNCHGSVAYNGYDELPCQRSVTEFSSGQIRPLADG